MKIAGHEIKNEYVAIGGVGLAGVYLFWKHQANAANAAASTSGASSTAVDPVTGLPYSQDNTVDPATGLTYLAEAQQYGSVQAAEQMITSGSAFFGDTGTGVQDTGFPTFGNPGNTTPTTSTTYVTNAQWASAVQAGLVGIGYSSQSIAQALGLYFASLPMSATDAQIMQTALAEFGPPPTGSYSIITSPTTGTGVSWKSVSAPGNKTLAQLQEEADPKVTWTQVLEQNPWAIKDTGKDIPKGYIVHLGYASTTS